MTQYTYLSIALQNTRSLKQVVNLINRGGRIEVIEFTPEQLSGQYAYEATFSESDYYDIDDVDTESLEAHLDVLKEAGAIFDYADALDHAKLLTSRMLYFLREKEE